MIKLPRLICVLSLSTSAVLSSLALAHEVDHEHHHDHYDKHDHHDHGAHVHGLGLVDLAIDGDKLTLNLTIPRQDILGFEVISTEAQSNQYHASIKTLSSKSIWILSSNANCIFKSAINHEPSSSNTGTQPEHHIDIHLLYSYECTNPSALTTVGTNLFSQFLNSQKLNIQYFTPVGQGYFTLSREAPEGKIK